MIHRNTDLIHKAIVVVGWGDLKMHDFRNCKRCGKLFASSYGSVCQQCLAKDESDFKLVKEYIYEHDGVTITEVSEATGVPAQRILRYLKEERLELNGTGGGILLSCESCGTAILSGRYCESCKNDLANGLRREVVGLAKKPEKAGVESLEKNKMYTAIRRK